MISKFYSPTMEFSDNKCAICCSELRDAIKMTVDTEFVEATLWGVYMQGNCWSAVLVQEDLIAELEADHHTHIGK